MTFMAACAWSVLRSLVIALAGLFIAVRLTSTLRALSGPRATLWWGLTLLPVFVPGLLIGYGYRNFALSLVHHPAWNELLYTVLMTLQVIPVGVLVLICAPPPPVSASALHVRRLATGSAALWHDTPCRAVTTRSVVAHWRMLSEWLRHHLFAWSPAWAVMVLLAFQESEVATLMQADGWTEWLFTRYAGGLTMDAALQGLTVPMLVQLALLATTLWIVIAGSDTSRSETPAATTALVGNPWIVFTYASIAFVSLAGLPGAVVLRGTWQGFSVLGAHPTLLREIGIAVLFSMTAGGFTWLLSGQMIRSLGGLGRVSMSIGLLPGLMGALALGVGVAGLVQQPPLVMLRDTPLPLLVAEVLFLLPRAMLIRLLVGRMSDSSAVHTARLLAGSNDRRRQRTSAGLLWRMDVAVRCGALMLVCYWAYIELTLPSLLAPPGMTPAPVVLYNLMHYGQISGLSAMLFASMTTPVVLMGVAWWGFRFAVQRMQSF